MIRQLENKHKKRRLIMKGLTIRRKLIFVFTILVIVIFSMGIYSISTLKAVNDGSTFIATNSIPGIQSSGRINTMTSDFRVLELQHIIAQDKPTMDSLEQQMTAKNNEITAELSVYEKTIEDPKDRDLYNTIVSQWNSYLTIHNNVLDLSRQLKTDEAVNLMNNDSKK